MVKTQKEIYFINDCGAIVDYSELRNAIYWYSDKPVCSSKHIYMYGNYPAISICKEKIHVHRLLMMYWLRAKIPAEYSVHHINEDKTDARKENLSLVLNSVHNSNHNKGKKPTQKAVEKLIERNHKRKGTSQPYKRNDVTTQKVAELVQKGYSVNRISIELKCDWSTIKARIYDNPELLEVEEHE